MKPTTYTPHPYGDWLFGLSVVILRSSASWFRSMTFRMQALRFRAFRYTLAYSYRYSLLYMNKNPYPNALLKPQTEAALRKEANSLSPKKLSAPKPLSP